MTKHLSTTLLFLGFLIILREVVSAKINIKICRKRNGHFPKPGSLCKAYYKCTNFIPVEFICPSEEHFSTTKLRCDWMDLVPCFEKPKRAECPTADGKFLKPGTGCIYYYDCCNGEPTEKKCPQGQLFDPSKKGCELKEHYACIENISTEEPISVFVTTSRISEPTPEEIVPPTTTIRESTLEEIAPSTTEISDSTSEEIEHSTASTSEDEIYPATLIKESTLEEIIPSTTAIQNSTSEELARSTTSTQEATSEEEVYFTTSVGESNPDEIVSSSVENTESTPEETVYSTTSKVETTPEEIEESTTLICETTFEDSTTIEIDERTTIREEVSHSTENELITDEPNIMCPEPFGYFPHPTDKHKFVGCVDNIPTVLTCPSDLIYDHEHRQCVYQ